MPAIRDTAPILALLALEHLRAVTEACADHIQGIAATRAAVGDHASLQKIAAGCADLAKQLGQPHLPEQEVAILRRVGTEGALMALGMSYRAGEAMDALAQRVWAEAKTDLEGCAPTLLEANHHQVMGRVRETLLAWRGSFAQVTRMSEGASRREIERLCQPLIAVSAICLLSAASDITEG